MTDRLYDCDEHKRHLRHQPVQLRATCRAQSTAGGCGSHAAARQTLRHMHEKWVRYSIQRVMTPARFVTHPHYRTGSLGAGYAVVSDWQAFLRLGDRLGARQHSVYEISSNITGIMNPLCRVSVRHSALLKRLSIQEGHAIEHMFDFATCLTYNARAGHTPIYS